MTREFMFSFRNIVESLRAAGHTESDAIAMIDRLLSEHQRVLAAVDETRDNAVSLSSREYDLCMAIANALLSGGMSKGGAILLTAMYACAVEDRIAHGTR